RESSFQCEELRVVCGTRGVPGTVAPFRAWRGSRDLVAQSPKLHAPAVARRTQLPAEILAHRIRPNQSVSSDVSWNCLQSGNSARLAARFFLGPGPALSQACFRQETTTEVPMKPYLCAAIMLFAFVASPPKASDEDAIHKILEQQVAAWNRGDAAAYAENF